MGAEEQEYRRSDFAPTKELKTMVYSAFGVFAAILGAPRKKQAVVYPLFHGISPHELSEWGRGKKPVGFYSRLIDIFNFTASPSQIKDQRSYDLIRERVRANVGYDSHMKSVVEMLSKRREEVQKNLPSASERIAAGNLAKAVEFAEAMLVSDPHAHPNGKLEHPVFPEHIKHIGALVRSAEPESQITIHADAVDYGSFRNFELHRELIDAIAAKARQGVTVRYLVWLDRKPMSLANKYRNPEERKSPDFSMDVRNFLKALKRHTNLSQTDEFKSVEGCLLKKPDWVNDKGDIRKLSVLLMKLHDCELAELVAAKVRVRTTDRAEDLEEVGALYAGSEPAFYWIVDGTNGMRGVVVQPTHGTDASAYLSNNVGILGGLLTNFYSKFDHLPEV